MQDLKPKNIKKKHKKTSQNESQNLLKSCVGTLLGPLLVLLEPLGLIWKKTSKKLHLFEINLGPQIQQKSKKIDVEKELVLRYVFFFDFLRFCVDFGVSKPTFLDQIC